MLPINAPTVEPQFPLLENKNERVNSYETCQFPLNFPIQRICAIALFTMIDGFFIFIFGHYYPSWYLLFLIVLCCGLLLSSITAISNKIPFLLIPTLIAKVVSPKQGHWRKYFQSILCACLLYVVGISIGLYREIRFPTPVDPKVQDVDVRKILYCVRKFRHLIISYPFNIFRTILSQYFRNNQTESSGFMFVVEVRRKQII